MREINFITYWFNSLRKCISDNMIFSIIQKMSHGYTSNGWKWMRFSGLRRWCLYVMKSLEKKMQKMLPHSTERISVLQFYFGKKKTLERVKGFLDRPNLHKNKIDCSCEYWIEYPFLRHAEIKHMCLKAYIAVTKVFYMNHRMTETNYVREAKTLLRRHSLYSQQSGRWKYRPLIRRITNTTFCPSSNSMLHDSTDFIGDVQLVSY